MQVHVLASSSSGNAAVVELAGHRFLIDAGISCAALEHGLWCCGLKPADLSAVFITHEHQDHIKGLETFIRRSRLPVFTRRATWEKLACRDLLPPGCVREITDSLVLEGVTVETFSISHDALIRWASPSTAREKPLCWQPTSAPPPVRLKMPCAKRTA